MKASYTDLPATYEVSGDELRIRFDIVESTFQFIEGETQTLYECEEALVSRFASRSQIIEAIIACKYPTPGAEFAASGSADIIELRAKAKALADGYLSGRTNVTAEQVNAERDRRLVALAEQYTVQERETWHVQRAEAEALAADPSAPAPMLRGIAAKRGVPVAEIAARVTALSDAFAAASGSILGAAVALIAQEPIPADYKSDEWWQA